MTHTTDSSLLQAPRRRKLLQRIGIGTTGMALSAGGVVQAATALPGPSPVDTGHVENGRIVFPEWRGPADAPSSPPTAPLPRSERMGIAIVALGRLSLEQILPAFAQSTQARPVALVSGSPEKMKVVARQYGIAPEACHSYADFEKLRDNPEVQAVYIVLPNALHREYVERAAAIGKHVLCEKPMAVSSAEARAMVAACERAKVKLMVAYRIHYQPHNQRVRRFVQDKTFGRLVGFTAVNVQTAAADAAQQWRHKKALSGGGSLPDIGLYCLNTVRFITGEEPVEVYAHLFSPPGDARYAEVEETVDFSLRFPSGLVAHCMTSYGGRENKWQRLELEKASIDMPSAYEYQGQRLLIGQRVEDSKGQTEVTLPPKNQFAAEIDHFAECVRLDRTPRTPGEEGLRDQVLMEAIYESARTGRPVKTA
ncbi:Gfo/Idh/MocA family oxidoreductase [Xylophilus sp. GOD-11R]|uniref:Gfo/Idh/MocA family protein n=1 Tax=Xylophilus sp. GOD-11R TaxID=3089814 RepID=UPI00298C4BFE|nr:Gfo/Idh/MocA family oxidoreductase [Xylophilus sp. GOD-11R]WPB58365.1 Gfo/Idh/MocA family oxidoreductase [Xylophilus sp. GOD-11R]